MIRTDQRAWWRLAGDHGAAREQKEISLPACLCCPTAHLSCLLPITQVVKIWETQNYFSEQALQVRRVPVVGCSRWRGSVSPVANTSNSDWKWRGFGKFGSVVVLGYLCSLCCRLVLLVFTLSSSCVTCVNSVVVLGYLCSLAITVHREMQLGHCPQTQVRACETCSLFS